MDTPSWVQYFTRQAC